LATAYYALFHIGRLNKGDFIFIHLAATGAGLFALYLAKHVGAIPVCTADTPFRVRYLRLIGVDYVLDINSTTLVQDILRITKGHGIDVFVNCGESIVSKNIGMKAAARRGRVLEVGFSIESSSGDTSLSKGNVALYRIDFTELIILEDPVVGDILEQCSSLLSSSFIPTPPVRVYSLSEAAEAYKYFQELKHIGKLILGPVAESYASAAFPVTRDILPPSSQGSYVREDGTYLVTGGTQGFTLELAKGLLDRFFFYIFLKFYDNIEVARTLCCALVLGQGILLERHYLNLFVNSTRPILWLDRVILLYPLNLGGYWKK
jgi:hypothetical protein